jgi:hydroxymethylpyrimidine/phosphomethylpyrimidine kinase
VLEDIPVRSIKTGMLSDKLVIERVAKVLEEYSVSQRPQLVVDPVMVSTSGHRLLQTSAVDTMKTQLLPLATLVTPNLPEAKILLPHQFNDQGQGLMSVEQMKTAAQAISDSYGVPNVLIKGGHLEAPDDIGLAGDGTGVSIEYADICDPCYPAILKNALGTKEPIKEHGLVVDVLFTQNRTLTSASDGSFVLFVCPRLNTQSTHGTGCTLSAAIACELAMGSSSKLFGEFVLEDI